MLGGPEDRMAVESEVLAFGPFRVFPGRRMLMWGEEPVAIGGRAFDVLHALLLRPGELVTKEELLGQVWPNLFVEESNLRVSVRAVRRALAQYVDGEFIVNISGRGYRFVSPVERQAAPPPPARRSNRHAIPRTRGSVIGREEETAEAARLLLRDRLVTLVGAGGMGKTTVALAVAERLADGFADGVRFVDLSPLADAKLAPMALAAILGLSVDASVPQNGIVDALLAKQMLIVLDTCEHVVGTIAPLVERLIEEAPGIHVLATSREPLRVFGEREFAISPLRIPDAGEALTPDEALACSAVALFVARARDTVEGFTLESDDVAGVVELCRRLEGMPLAIEIAAARVRTLGLSGLLEVLDDRFSLLMRGRSTALERQQTLGATLEWSFRLLGEREQVVLRRLAVFRGSFTLPCAASILSFDCLDPAAIGEALHELAARSLIVLDGAPDAIRYRLLDMTRAYATERLAESPDDQPVRARHARYFHDLLIGMQDEWSGGRRTHWRIELGRSIDDVRAALGWAMADVASLPMAASLTSAAAPLLFAHMLIDECRRRTEAVLEQDLSGTVIQPLLRSRLHEVLGSARWHIQGPAPARTAYSTALDLAAGAEDNPAQMRALWGLWTTTIIEADYQEAQNITERFRRLAAPGHDHRADLLHGRMAALSAHFTGRFEEAREAGRSVLRHPSIVRHLDPNSGLQFDQAVAAKTVIARSLWIEGKSEAALAMASEALGDARAAGDPLSLCYTLTVAAVPIAHWTGELELCATRVRQLLEISADHGLAHWHSWGRGFERALGHSGIGHVHPQGRLAAGQPLIAFQLDALATMAPEMANEETILRGEDGRSAWSSAEMLRIRGLRRRAAGDTRGAREAFERSLRIARSQHALAWELRTATSFAEMLRDGGCYGAARDVLVTVLARISEGSGTCDLIRAQRLLSDLEGSAPGQAKGARRDAEASGEVPREMALICKPDLERDLCDRPFRLH